VTAEFYARLFCLYHRSIATCASVLLAHVPADLCDHTHVHVSGMYILMILFGVLYLWSRLAPRLAKEKWEFKYRMCFLKYKASYSVWLENSHRSSTGTSGICIFTFPCLQQKEGTVSHCNNHRVSLCSVQNAYLVNCGNPCRTDQLHLFSGFQPGTICILHLKK
jgi:hypothetical protein